MKTREGWEARCRTSPSLALLKYWGKRGGRANLPATPSLAVTLGGLHTETRVRAAGADAVWVGERLQDPDRYRPFFARLRRGLGTRLHFEARSTNDFPHSAGLASSSSGFAALALACARLAAGDGPLPDAATLSGLARYGSASAARAVFGGFTLLPAGARAALPLYGPEHWPALRILVVVVDRSAKPLSSRQAMERTRVESPYYRNWLRSSAALLPEALEALRERDLERLGQVALLSYSRMHAALLAASPPALYWLPATVAVIRECADLRREGVGAWETIDAGPQVKVLCLAADLERIRGRFRELLPGAALLEARPGPAPVCELRETSMERTP